MNNIPDFDENALLEACKEVANQTMWQFPINHVENIEDIIDTEQKNKMIELYFNEAKENVEFVIEQGFDPNLITRAVVYIAETHAIPPIRENIKWFYDTLHTLIELCCPNVMHSSENSIAVFKDIENGIKYIRDNVNKG